MTNGKLQASDPISTASAYKLLEVEQICISEAAFNCKGNAIVTVIPAKLSHCYKASSLTDSEAAGMPLLINA